MTIPLGPTVRRRQLGAELARLREAAGMTTRDAAEVLGCSVAKIGHLERGRYGVRKAELASLLSVYSASAEVCEVLEEMRREGSQRGWWATYRLPEWAKPFVGLESAASSVRTFELELVPGLLQTEAYARAVHTAGRHLTKPEDVEKRVSARMARQRRLTEPPSVLELWAVMSEAAICREVGGSEVMQEQLHALLELAALPNVKVQVLPFAAGAHGAMSGPLTVLSFPSHTDPDVGYQEYPVGGHLVEDVDAVARMSVIFDDLRAAAMSTRESAQLIARAAEQYRRRSEGGHGD